MRKISGPSALGKGFEAHVQGGAPRALPLAPTAGRGAPALTRIHREFGAWATINPTTLSHVNRSGL